MLLWLVPDSVMEFSMVVTGLALNRLLAAKRAVLG